MDLHIMWERIYISNQISSKPWRMHLHLMQVAKENERFKRKKQEDQGGKQGKTREKKAGTLGRIRFKVQETVSAFGNMPHKVA